MYYDAYMAPLQAPVIVRVTDGTEANTSQEGSYLAQLKAELALDPAITDYDEALSIKLRSAISAVEQYTRLGLYPATVTVVYSGYDGSPVPFGPVWDTPAPTVTGGSDGGSVTITRVGSTGLSAGDFPVVLAPFSGGTVTFKGGYSMESADNRLPDPGLIGAVLAHAASAFRSGGITGTGSPGTYWKTLAAPFRRF